MQIQQWNVVDTNGPRGAVEIGDKFQNLTAKEFIGFTDKKKSVWLWTCDCGNEVYNIAQAVKYGNTHSCGCVLKAQRYTVNFKHGMRKSREYNIWCHIKGRCCNPSNGKYPYYGGRGIKMDQRWIDSFEEFYADMGPIPEGASSIDRKNSDGDYNKANCRWSDQLTQVSNRRSNRYIHYAGKIWTLAQMGRDLGLNGERLDYLLRSGYEIDEIRYRIEHDIGFRKGRPNRRMLVDESDIYVPYDKIDEVLYAICK